LALYTGESQRRGQVDAWVRRGLDVGAKILFIEPSGQPPTRSLSGLLGRRPDALEAMMSGQIEVIPASQEAYDPAWQASVSQRWLRRYPLVRWAGDATTAWAVMSRTRHAEIERVTDKVCESQQVSVMCHYPASAAMETLGDLSATHSAGMREELLQATPMADGGLAVSGEVDCSNHALLRSVLLAATRTAGSTFVVDLSGVRFLDVAGVRALLAGTDPYRGQGGQVRLYVPPRVDRLARLLGLDREPGILTEALG
jgi:anti-anti-sigma factor